MVRDHGIDESLVVRDVVIRTDFHLAHAHAHAAGWRQEIPLRPPGFQLGDLFALGLDDGVRQREDLGRLALVSASFAISTAPW